ncbi:MAG: NADH-quinone oxidoreductase subunit N, partial [Candidatus Zixiibacteriota bacterium]
MNTPTLPTYDIWQMAPEIVLFLWALVVITFDVSTRRRSPQAVGYMALAGPVVTILVGVLLYAGGKYAIGGSNGVGFGMMFVNESASVFFKLIFLGAAFLAIAMSFDYLREQIVHHRGEYYGMMLMSTVGMMFLASSNELLSLYVGLELTTVPLFVLAAFYKDDKLSVESGIKYLIVGAFSSALLVYGISFMYGFSGTTFLRPVVEKVGNVSMYSSVSFNLSQVRHLGIILILANVCLLAGLGFKLALPPFHQWTPDVYEGAPTPVTAFLSVGSKAAGLIAFAKVMIDGLHQFYDPEMMPNDWGILAGIMAASAMIIGNVLAVRQTNVKRLLAYSSIAQAGYIMVGMLSYNDLGLASVGFYVFVYMFANMGAFAVVAAIEGKTGSVDLRAFRGLS